MTTDIEARLAAALRAGAATVTDDMAPEFAPNHQPRQRIWLVLGAAAAVVVLVAALAVALARGRNRTTPVAPPMTVGPTCIVPLPASWRAALRAHRVVIPETAPNTGLTPTLMAVTDDGTALVQTYTGAHAPELIGVAPDGTKRVVLAEGYVAGFVAVATSGSWAVAQENGNGGADVLIAVQLATGRTVAVRRGSTTTGPEVTAPVVLDDTVYWSARTPAGRAVYAFDLDTRTRTTLDVGADDGPVRVGGVIAWRHGGAVRAAPDGAQPPSRRELDAAREPSRAMTGPYLASASADGVTVRDTRTGAAVRLPRTAGALAIAAGGGTLAIGESLPGVVHVLPVADLPELHC